MAIILQCLIIKHFVTHLPDIASSAMFLFVRRIRCSCQKYKILTVSGIVVVIALSPCLKVPSLIDLNKLSDDTVKSSTIDIFKDIVLKQQ